MFRYLCGAAFVVAALSTTSAARADDGTTLSASYDFFLNDTVFVLTNNSTQTDTSVTLTTNFGPTTSVTIDDIAAGATEYFAFDAPNGGFIIDPASKGLSDSTMYQFSVDVNGIIQTSAWFSPGSNLTGQYVDFLGNTCFGLSGCGVAQSGIVAAVPEPAPMALFTLPLLGLAAARLRRRA